MATEYSVVSDPLVFVRITSSVTSFGSERRFERSLNIVSLKNKLELLTGAASGSMNLEVYNKDDKLVCALDDDEALLGSYPVDNGFRIHVIDKFTKAGEYEDVSKVEKYEMAPEEYEKRTDTVRAYKERMKLGRFNPEEQKRREVEKEKILKEEEQKMVDIQIGDRCEVRVPGQPTKRGTVKFKGTTEFQEGNWIGVHYDEPAGKNDGSVKGKRYFECPPKYGGFVRPITVQVGEFPEEFDDDLDEL